MIRFGLLGIPVTVRWWFWLTAALISGVVGSADPTAVFVLLVWMGVVFVSVLWHEMGHALAFRRYGRPSEIVLQAFGGYTSPQRGGVLTRREDLVITAAGPVFGFALWMALYGLMKLGMIPSEGARGWGLMMPGESLPQPLRWALLDLQKVNLWWSILNLIPVAPLDGGRILAAAMGPGRARQAQRISLVCGGAVTMLAFVGGQLFLAVLFGFLTYENWQKAKGGSFSGGLFGRR